MRSCPSGLRILAFLLIAFFPLAARAGGGVHHDIKLVLSPPEHRLNAVDTVTLPAGVRRLSFALHTGLRPSSSTPGVRILRKAVLPGAVPRETYDAVLPSNLRAFTLSYEGIIHHPLEESGHEQARGSRDTPGIISEEGVVLSGASAWYPDFGVGLVTFDLETRLPAGWDAVSQGERTLHARSGQGTTVRWKSPEPQDEIFVIAARFVEYAGSPDPVQAMVFLRAPDQELAGSYLEATKNYIELYSNLIGPYPYKKFALVENFWETGFGMPSFTLLGPAVIRLPFIIKTSYPHEILHNWWGNGVYPVYEQGNWSEGLTAYLSDYLMQEQQDAGAGYRRDALQKYADYVLDNRDFPLSRFRSRHSASSEAIGYGKSLMFFHMLRGELGDETFRQGLRDFYGTFKFRFASFDDLRSRLEAVSGRDLRAVFEQWLSRTGAPELRISAPAALPDKDGYLLTALLEQTQPGPAYRLRVPLAVTLADREQALQVPVDMPDKRIEVKLRLAGRPVRLDVDPEFDLFRRLGAGEAPPAISQALGAKKMLVILPSSAGQSLMTAYRELARALGRSGPEEVEVKLDSEIRALPEDRAVAVLGWENRFLPDLRSSLSAYDAVLDGGASRIESTRVPGKNHSLVIAAPLPKTGDHAALFIATDLPAALSGLGRKLPHYHKYSYLVFEGGEPKNVAKGRWPLADSPLTLLIPGAQGKAGRAGRGRLSARAPLVPPGSTR